MQVHRCELHGLLFQLDAYILVRVKVNKDSQIFHSFLLNQSIRLGEKEMM